MTLKNKSIVVLLSGGLDSSTVTGIAKKSEAKIFGLSFDYGQRHKKENKIFYLQPAWNNKNGFSLAIDFVKNNPDWKLSLQTHKYLKIN